MDPIERLENIYSSITHEVDLKNALKSKFEVEIPSIVNTEEERAAYLSDFIYELEESDRFDSLRYVLNYPNLPVHGADSHTTIGRAAQLAIIWHMDVFLEALLNLAAARKSGNADDIVRCEQELQARMS